MTEQERQEEWRRYRARVNAARREHRERMEAEGYEVAGSEYQLPAGPPNGWQPDGSPTEGVTRPIQAVNPKTGAPVSTITGEPAVRDNPKGGAFNRLATFLGSDVR